MVYTWKPKPWEKCRERTKKKEREKKRSKDRTLIINSISETLQGKDTYRRVRELGRKERRNERCLVLLTLREDRVFNKTC